MAKHEGAGVYLVESIIAEMENKENRKEEKIMENECRKYAQGVAEDIEKIYNGTTEEENNDGEKMSLYDYVADALDFEVILASTKTVKAVRLYVTLGGPTCYVDTELHAVVCAWGGDREEYPLDWDVCDELESIIAEYMEMER